MWNYLPASLKDCDSIETFRKRCKEHFELLFHQKILPSMDGHFNIVNFVFYRFLHYAGI